MFGEPKNKDYIDSYCSICGHYLTSRHLIAGAINGDMIDFNEREYLEINWVVCSECFDKIKEIERGGVIKAKKSVRGRK